MGSIQIQTNVFRSQTNYLVNKKRNTNLRRHRNHQEAWLDCRNKTTGDSLVPEKLDAVQRINRTLETFYELFENGNTPSHAATDLLTDLYHWCDQQEFNIDINQLHRMAVAHHAEETTRKGN